MKRLIRVAAWTVAAVAVLAAVRSILKRWIDGPEVTPDSGGWTQRPAQGPAAEPAEPAAPGAAVHTAGPSGSPQRPAWEPAPSPEQPEVVPGSPAQSPGKKAGSRRRTDVSPPGSWVSGNGAAEAPGTHPVKVKLASRVYRVPGMATYDRTVPDRCYTTVEAAEADGFKRAAR